jgi:hypothetical protein
METANTENRMQRRGFFARLFSSAAGIGILGSRIPSFLKTSITWKDNISIQATIHPQAVSRMKKDCDSHG